jgi:hypothetical protein
MPHSLTFEEQPDGAHRTTIEYAAVAYDAETKRVNYLDRGVQLTISAEQFARTIFWEGAGAFRPLNNGQNRVGFSPGLSFVQPLPIRQTLPGPVFHLSTHQKPQLHHSCALRPHPLRPTLRVTARLRDG